MGFTIGGSYKGFGFSMLLYSALGVYKEAIAAYLWDFPAGNIKTQPNTLDSWKPGTHAEGAVRPSIHVNNAYNSVASTYSYSDHSYLRLKNLEFNYSFPQRILDKIRLTRLQIYINGNNLLTFSKCDPRRDPEHGGQYIYPMVRRYNIGFRIGL